MVKVAARPFTNLPTGFARVSPSRYMSIRCFSSSGGVPIVNESRPMPFSPMMRWLSGLDVAPHSGGCGSWSGFGSTRRGGILNALPFHSSTSFVHAATMTATASSHSSRVRCGSMPKPSSSARVDDRPVPNSTRPSERRSSTAADSAERTGWLYGNGMSRTP
jgi:hypothetical protein